jgi:hypothetical protein
VDNSYIIEPGQEWTVDLFRPEDAPGVTRLFLDVYGRGYPIRTFIDPDFLIQENAAGRTVSSVARTVKGDIVGHNALFNSAASDKTFESGAGLVHKDYRGGKGIFTKMVEHGVNVAADSIKADAIFGESVCNHVFSQKMCHGLGWISHAVEVDLMPAAAYVKEQSAAGRVSALLDFKPVKPYPHTVYLPDEYRPFLEFIYNGLDDERSLERPHGDLPAEDTRIEARVFDFAQVARLPVIQIGRDFETAMARLEKELSDKGMQVIQVWLKLSEPYVHHAVSILREQGYFLGGVLPRWFGVDGLLMQKISVRPSWEGIVLAFDRGKAIVDYAREDWEQTQK